MNLHNADIEISAVDAAQYPKTDVPEFAFAGRSNVGKSSLINKLLNRKSLARVSGTPGKDGRQLIFITSMTQFS